MLTTTVELWPHGSGNRAKRLVTINIANYGQNTDGTNNYLYTIEETEPLFGSPIWHVGKLEKWDRKQDCTALLTAVLRHYTEFPQQELSQSDRDAAERLARKNT